MSTLPFQKPSRTARKREALESRRDAVRAEMAEKRKVRARDRRCRFPLCGCGPMRLRLEVSHDFHKGMGSKGGVSLASLMVLLCEHRHQHGAVSRHKGTLRAKYLTPDGYDGPVAWEIDMEALRRPRWQSVEPRFAEVARESRPGQIEPLQVWQREALETLSQMEK